MWRTLRGNLVMTLAFNAASSPDEELEYHGDAGESMARGAAP
jgi:hypothetical protein